MLQPVGENEVRGGRTRGQKKAEAFRRLAAQRTNAVLERLRILGNCANRSVYDYTEADVRKIFKAIDDEVKRTRAKFSDSRKEKFQL